MRSNNKTMFTLVLAALFTTITLLCTLILKIPVGPNTYIHLGDAIMFLGVIVLPRKYACFAGPVGAALADIMGGFAVWAPWTFVIKLLSVLVLGFTIDIIRRKYDSESKVATFLGVPCLEMLGYLIAIAIGVVGYYLAEAILYGNWIVAAAGMPLNVLQILSGAIIAVVISNAFAASSIKDTMYYIRKK